MTASLAHWLTAHHQVVSARELTRLGLPRQFAHSQVRAGRWQRVHAGVWCTYTGPLTFLSRCAAALAALGDEAVLDSDTAARVLKLRRARADTPIRVVIPHGTRRKKLKGVVIRQSRTLTERSHLTRQGLRVVRAERAVLGMAIRLPRQAPTVLTEAVQQGLTTADRLRGTLLGLGIVPGRRRLLTVLDDIGGGSRSHLESCFIALVARAGLPVFTQNYPLRIEDRRLWLDVCEVDLRIAIEIDGKAYHLFSEDWEDDLERQNDIVLDGWLVLRFTARAIREHPDLVVSRVRRAVELRQRAVAADPGRSARAS